MVEPRKRTHALPDLILGQSGINCNSVIQIGGRVLPDCPSLNSGNSNTSSQRVALKLPKGCQKCLPQGCHPTPCTRIPCQLAPARTNICSSSFLRDKCRNTLIHWAATKFITPPQGDTLCGNGFGSLCPLRGSGSSKSSRPTPHAACSPANRWSSLAPPAARRRPAPGRHAAARAPHDAPNTQTQPHGRMNP